MTQNLIDRLRDGALDSGYRGVDIDEVGLLRGVDPATLTPIADHLQAARYGFEPDFMFICWEGVKRA